MTPLGREYSQKCFTSVVAFAMFGLLAVSVLANNLMLTIFFFCLIAPYFVMIPFGRFNIVIYLNSINYTIILTYLCLIFAMSYTLLPPTNAVNYYSLTAPWNYVTWCCAVMPSLMLMVHLLNKGLKPLNDVAYAYTDLRQKINTKTGQYFLNQKINIFKDITRFQINDCKLEKTLNRHANAVSRALMLCYAALPLLPVFLLRVAGQQPVDFVLLIFTSYLSLIYAIALIAGIHTTRAVMYIQKKHNIKLKLAYKKDVILV